MADDGDGRSSVAAEVALFVLALGEVDDFGRVLIATARELAREIDTASYGEKPRSAAGPVRELRAVLADLDARKVRAGGDDDGWTFDSEGETGAAGTDPAGARDAALRDTPESRPKDVRSGGRRGKQADAPAADAVAATRSRRRARDRPGDG